MFTAQAALSNDFENLGRLNVYFDILWITECNGKHEWDSVSKKEGQYDPIHRTSKLKIIRKSITKFLNF